MFYCVNLLFILLLIFIVCFFLYAIKDLHFKITPENITIKAKKLGIHEDSLTTSMGNISTDHYEHLVKIMNVESYKSTIRSFIIAIVAAFVAIISAYCAVYTAYEAHLENITSTNIAHIDSNKKT